MVESGKTGFKGQQPSVLATDGPPPEGAEIVVFGPKEQRNEIERLQKKKLDLEARMRAVQLPDKQQKFRQRIDMINDKMKLLSR